uniref:Uncharacterized protein n=1 Tax=Romanomermis culicivorax TaxID=13658 RepID=A0A915J4A6_ROMCU
TALVQFARLPAETGIFLTNTGSAKVVCELKVTEFDCLRASPFKFYLNPDEKKKIKLQFLQYNPEVFTLSTNDSAQTHKYRSKDDHIFTMEDATPAEYCHIVPNNQRRMHILNVDLPPEVTKEQARGRFRDSYAEVTVPYNPIEQ